MKSWTLILGVVLFGVAAAAQSAPTAPALAAGNVDVRPVTLPFDPPTGTDIRYRFEKRTERQGQVELLESQDRLRFAANGNGYTLTWASENVRVTAPGPMQRILQRMYQDLSVKPVTIILTAAGQPVDLEGLVDWRALSTQALTNLTGDVDTIFADAPAAMRDRLRQMMQGIADMQAKQSDAQFKTEMLQTSQILLQKNRPLKPGVPELLQGEAPLSFGTGQIPVLIKLELTDYKPGQSARIVLSSAAEPKALANAMQNFIKALLDKITDPAGRAEAEAAIAKLPPPQLTEEVIQEIRLPSGLPDRVEYRKSIAIPGEPPRNETQIFERLP